MLQRIQKYQRLLTLSIGLIIVALVSIYIQSDTVTAATGINRQINFQGKVVNSDGTNVADGSYNFEFKLYTVDTAGSAIWTETRTGGNQVTVQDGIFRVSLGSVTSLPGSVDFNTDNIYLSVNFNGDGEMSPRIRFTAVPYAFNAEKVAGLTVTNTTGTLTIPDATIAFSGNNDVTFTSTGTTTLTLPTTGTLATLAGTETFSNKTIASTGLTVQDNTWIGLGSGAGRIEFDDQARDEINFLSSNVGINTAAPASRLHVYNTQVNTTTTTSEYTAQHVLDATTNVAGNRRYDNSRAFFQHLGNANNTGYAKNLVVDSWNSNTATTTTIYGIYNTLMNSNTGTLQNAYGNYTHVWQLNGTIDTSYGNYINIQGATTGYAVYIQDIVATTAYGMYQAGSDDLNYFAGNVGLGTTTIPRLLTVNGAMRLNTSSAPGSPAAGDIYADGTDVFYHDGSGWVDLTVQGGTTYWSNTLNALHPKDELAGVADLLIGGSSTASANIRLTSDGTGYFAGNVGIGTSDPSANLQIGNYTKLSPSELFLITDSGLDSTIKFTEESSSFGWDINYDGTNTNDLYFVRHENSVGGEIAVTFQRNSGNVGIGTTSPAAKLQLVGDLYAPTATFSASYAGGTPLTIKGAASQTADLTSWKDSAGTTVLSITNDGFIDLTNSATPNAWNTIFQFNDWNVGTSEVAGGFGNGVIKYNVDGRTFLNLITDNGANSLFSGGVDTETYRRFAMTGHGKWQLGGGSATVDTFLERSTSGGWLVSTTASNVPTLKSSGYINLATISTPGSPAEGDIYADGTDVFYHDGSGWVDLTVQGGTTYWSNTLNALHPKDELAGVADLLIGGSSTASANVRLGSSGTGYFAGNVSIGTTTTSEQLNLGGAVTILGSKVLNYDSSTYSLMVGSGVTNVSGAEYNYGFGTTALDSINNIAADYNIGIGYDSLTTMTSGNQNTAVGHTSLRALTNGTHNVSVGNESLYTLSNGLGSAALGYQAGYYINSGNYNVAIGYQASKGTASYAGSGNVSLGGFAGWRLGSLSDNNVAIGYNAGLFLAGSSDDNVLVGREAGRGLGTSTNYNVFIGSQAGYGISGSSNVMIGYQAGYSATGSNKLYIENSNSSSPLIYGDFSTDLVTINGNLGVGTTSILQKVTIAGSGAAARIATKDTSTAGLNAQGGFEMYDSANARVGFNVMSTGIYWLGTDVVGGSISLRVNDNDIEGLTIESDGDVVIPTGNLGLGTTTIPRLLTVDGAMRLNTITTPGTPASGDIYSDGTDLFYYNGSGWDDLTGGGASYWGLTANALHPANEYAGVADVLVGGSSTASATIRLASNGQGYFASNVGIGSTAPQTKLDISLGAVTTTQTGAYTVASSVSAGQALWGSEVEINNISGYADGYVVTANSSTTGAEFITGISANINSLATTSNTTAGLSGLNVSAYSLSGGTVTNAWGSRLEMGNEDNSSIGTLQGLELELNNNGAGSTITNFYGAAIDFNNEGTIQNTYGFYVGDITAGTQTNTPFSFYASDANAHNYFAGNVGIGTTNPSYNLEVTQSAGSAITSLFTASNTSTDRPILLFKRATGTVASPLTVGTEEWLGSFQANGYNGSSYYSAAGIDFYTDGAIVSSRPRGSIRFSTGNDSGTFAEGMRLNHDGNLGIGSTSPTQKLDVNGDIAIKGTLDMHFDTTSQSFFVGGGSVGVYTGAIHNYAFGVDALDGISNNSADFNVAIGYQSLTGLSSGFQNVAIGGQSMISMSTGQNNIGIGYYTLASSTGTGGSVAIGDYAASGLTGNYNTAVGFSAGYSVVGSTGFGNLLLGPFSGYNIQNGSDRNILVGGYTGYSMTTSSDYNVIVGYDAGRSLTSGSSNNVIVGATAGYTMTASSVNNVFLGYAAGYNETGSNKLYIENSNSSSPLIYGDFASDIVTINGNLGIGTTTPGISAGTGVHVTLSEDSWSTANRPTLEFDNPSDSITDGGRIAQLSVYTGTAQTEVAGIYSDAVGTSENAGRLEFWTATGGSLSERMRIDEGGNVGIGTTTIDSKLEIVTSSNQDILQIIGDSVTTNDGIDLSADGLTTGYAINAQTTSTALTTGGLLDLDWTPASVATASGDLFRLQLGAHADLTGNLFALYDSGTSLFKVSTTKISSGLPHEFTAAGDVTMAYDLIFTNQTSSNIESYGPLTISSGESYENLDLTLKPSGTGAVVIDDGSNLEMYADQQIILDVDDGSNSYIQFDNTNNRVEIFADGSERFRFTATGNNESNGTITTTLSDVAENYPTLNEKLEAGDVVVLQTQSEDGVAPYLVDASAQQTKELVVGVVSSKPGLVLGGSSFLSDMCAEVVQSQQKEDAVREELLRDEYRILLLQDLETTQRASETARLTEKEIAVLVQEASKNELEEEVPATTQQTINDRLQTCKAVKQVPVALAGRVPVKFDRSAGDINPGDLLMVSPTLEGHAVKASGTGWVIGRALEANTNDSETIMMFLSLAWYTGTDTFSGVTATQNDVLGASISLSDVYSTRTVGGSERAVISLSTNILGSLTADSITALEGFSTGLTSFARNEITTLNGAVLKLQTGYGAGSIEAFNKKLVMTSDGGIIAADTIQAARFAGSDESRGSVFATGTTISVPQNWDVPPASITLTPEYQAQVWVSDITTEGFVIHSSVSNPSKRIFWWAVW